MDKQDMDKYSIGLWVVVGLMVAVFSLQFWQGADPSLIFAGDDGEDYFTVFSCQKADVTDRTLGVPVALGEPKVFGWGNRAVGTGEKEFGCFNERGSRVAGINSFEECRAALCQ